MKADGVGVASEPIAFKAISSSIGSQISPLNTEHIVRFHQYWRERFIPYDVKGGYLIRYCRGMCVMISLPASVLVVEDEALIRLSLVADLEDAGFAVYEAAQADEALSLLRAHPEIEALFTDIDMPGSIDGLTLARLARQSHPEISILLTSGYLKVGKNELPPETVYFSKPYDVGHVVNHIRERVSAQAAERLLCFTLSSISVT